MGRKIQPPTAPGLYYLEPGSMTAESAVPATDQQVRDGVNLFVRADRKFTPTISHVTPATDREIRNARKALKGR